MNRDELIRQAIRKSTQSGGNRILEHEAKQILQQYGVNVVAEETAKDPDEAGNKAAGIGFPVVLKAITESASHKTEKGLVKIGLTDEKAVRQAACDIVENCGENVEMFLVQPMVEGRREFVAGLSTDPQFGPVVMLGLGGIFTEALNDVSFRVAPLKEPDAVSMMDELSSKALFRDFRGEKAADTEAVKKILLALSDLALQYPAIKEIDINPFILGPDGTVTVVDALMVTGEKMDSPFRAPSVDMRILRSCFYPESIAFVGASSTLGKWGHFMVTNTIGGGYQGKIYLVNPKGGTIAGRQAYRSVIDIEGPVDLAVVTVPAQRVAGIVPELEQKGIKGMLVITSGFREIGAEGARLEEELVKEAHAAGILVLGPNTMGICNPHINLFCTGTKVQPTAGSTALVCQSGNLGTQLLVFAEQQGIGIRAFSGSGNEAMVTIEDYMEAFENDDETRTVVLYIESVKDGRRFVQGAERVSGKKPVIVLNGGRTVSGNKAAASHSGALASDAKVFSAALKQAGVIEVDHTMDLLDYSAVFSSLPLPRGSRVAIMTLGGGWGVVTTDLCSEHGLEVPQLSDAIKEKLDGLLPSYWSRENPVDIVGERDEEIPVVASEELLKWDGCDALIHLGIHGQRLLGGRMLDSLLGADPLYTREQIESFKEAVAGREERYIEHIVRLTEKYEKPVLGVSLLVDEKTRSLYRMDECRYKGVFFPSPERAVKALSGMCRYKEWLDSRN
ncbi:MAG: acetate--CoA ligase family protein [Desulfarculaceae bacterium]|nr:acetate--CoA ligase family protein [Desulfarculaceae bacterium]